MTINNLNRWLIKALLLVGALILLQATLCCVGRTAHGDEVPWVDEHQYWTTLRDGSVDVCVTGGDFEWVKQTLQDGWGIESKEQCDDPDLAVTVKELPLWDSKRLCGLAQWGDPCQVDLNSWCFDNRDNFIADRVPEKALLHEVGHCAGFNHKDYDGIMFYVTSNWTSADDLQTLRERYGLANSLVPVPVTGAWTMSRWSGTAPTTPEGTGAQAIYILQDGTWLRYIQGAPEGVNTIQTIQPDQPMLVLG